MKTKHNEILESCKPQIAKLVKTQKRFAIVEAILFAGMLVALYILANLTPALF